MFTQVRKVVNFSYFGDKVEASEEFAGMFQHSYFSIISNTLFSEIISGKNRIYNEN